VSDGVYSTLYSMLSSRWAQSQHVATNKHKKATPTDRDCKFKLPVNRHMQ